MKPNVLGSGTGILSAFGDPTDRAPPGDAVPDQPELAHALGKVPGEVRASFAVQAAQAAGADRGFDVLQRFRPLLLVGARLGDDLERGRVITHGPGHHGDVGGRARVAAVVTVLLWLAIIFMGRSIAYDVEVWGSWHLA